MSDQIQFHLNISSPRWNHEDEYHVRANREELTISGVGKIATCRWVEDGNHNWSGHNDAIGNPLEQILENDMIYPPTIFVGAIEHAWMAWRDGTLDDGQFRDEFAALVDWLNLVAKSKPTTKFWKGIF